MSQWTCTYSQGFAIWLALFIGWQFLLLFQPWLGVHQSPIWRYSSCLYFVDSTICWRRRVQALSCCGFPVTSRYPYTLAWFEGSTPFCDALSIITSVQPYVCWNYLGRYKQPIILPFVTNDSETVGYSASIDLAGEAQRELHNETRKKWSLPCWFSAEEAHSPALRRTNTTYVIILGRWRWGRWSFVWTWCTSTSVLVFCVIGLPHCALECITLNLRGIALSSDIIVQLRSCQLQAQWTSSGHLNLSGLQLGFERTLPLDLALAGTCMPLIILSSIFLA